MNMHHDDALDQAIRSLPLEEAPAGLRASILRSTVYAPQVLESAFSFWEMALVGALSAVAIWLVVLVAIGGGSLFVQTLQAIGSAGARLLSNPGTLAWLAAGSATAVWLSVFTGSQPLEMASHRSKARVGR